MFVSHERLLSGEQKQRQPHAHPFVILSMVPGVVWPGVKVPAGHGAMCRWFW